VKILSLACLWFLGVGLFASSANAAQSAAQPHPLQPVLRVGVAGSEPFVVNRAGSFEGVAVEIWQALAANAGWRGHFDSFRNVPEALDALAKGTVDVVVGPVSITAERARFARFSQPYFSSSLSILSRTEPPTFWQRLAPFFSGSFYIAVIFFVSVLALVGTLIWLAERHAPQTGFAHEPGRGIANGIWFAIVTMSTVGYGDLAPRTLLGRMVTATWIVISIVTATSLIAGIASTLTLTGMQRNSIETADQLRGRRVAVIPDSPGQPFAERHGANPVGVASLDQGFAFLKQQAVDAMVFDRPQLLYILKERGESSLAVSRSNYARQNYGFAVQLSSPLISEINVRLLELQESGRVDRIVRAWLGEDDEDH
jgi:polar amino acid transport system substrate-binding protein